MLVGGGQTDRGHHSFLLCCREKRGFLYSMTGPKKKFVRRSVCVSVCSHFNFRRFGSIVLKFCRHLEQESSEVEFENGSYRCTAFEETGPETSHYKSTGENSCSRWCNGRPLDSQSEDRGSVPTLEALLLCFFLFRYGLDAEPQKVERKYKLNKTERKEKLQSEKKSHIGGVASQSSLRDHKELTTFSVT